DEVDVAAGDRGERGARIERLDGDGEAVLLEHVLREVRGGEGLVPAVERTDRDVRVLVGAEVDLSGLRTGRAVGPLAAGSVLGAAGLGGVGVGGTAGGEGEEAGGKSTGQRHE